MDLVYFENNVNLENNKKTGGVLSLVNFGV